VGKKIYHFDFGANRLYQKLINLYWRKWTIPEVPCRTFPSATVNHLYLPRATYVQYVSHMRHTVLNYFITNIVSTTDARALCVRIGVS